MPDKEITISASKKYFKFKLGIHHTDAPSWKLADTWTSFKHRFPQDSRKEFEEFVQRLKEDTYPVRFNGLVCAIDGESIRLVGETSTTLDRVNIINIKISIHYIEIEVQYSNYVGSLPSVEEMSMHEVVEETIRFLKETFIPTLFSYTSIEMPLWTTTFY